MKNYFIFLNLLLLSACSIVSPAPDHSQYYRLTPILKNERTTYPLDAWAVQLLTLPDYLTQPRLAYRDDTARWSFREYDRWADSFKQTFVEVLCRNLSDLTGHLVTSPIGMGRIQASRTLQVRIDAFGPRGDDKVCFEGNWTLLDENNKPLRHSPFNFQKNLRAHDSVSECVQTMSDLVYTLAGAIANDAS